MDAVAVGTIVLAIATLVLAVGVWRQVRLQGEQLAASERPCVYPITPHKWLAHLGDGGRWLTFRNGGTGIARNVRGRLWWHDKDGKASLIGQTLGPGDHFRVWLRERKEVTRWYGAEGYVIYEDVRGVEWQSRFRYEHTATKSGLGSSTGVRHLSSATPRPHFPARAGRTRTSPTWLSPCATGLDAGSTRRRSATRRRQAASVPRSQTLEFDPGSGLGGGRDRPHDPRRPPQHGDHANVPTPSRDGLPR